MTDPIRVQISVVAEAIYRIQSNLDAVQSQLSSILALQEPTVNDGLDAYDRQQIENMLNEGCPND